MDTRIGGSDLAFIYSDNRDHNSLTVEDNRVAQAVFRGCCNRKNSAEIQGETCYCEEQTTTQSMFVALRESGESPVVLMCDEAVTVVAATVLAEFAPIGVPSIAPPSISTVVKVAVPGQLIDCKVARPLEFRVVKLPGAAVLAPIVVLSIVPPSQSI